MGMNSRVGLERMEDRTMLMMALRMPPALWMSARLARVVAAVTLLGLVVLALAGNAWACEPRIDC
jgi:hypothetical protein